MSLQAEQASASAMRILVVDDERINRTVMEAMLRKMGHQPVSAGSGPEALVLLREQHPDLILMDVMMPEMDGYETVRAMRLMPEGQVPIIFLTALSKPEDMIKAVHAGGDDYLLKPVHFDLLGAKLKTHHERREMLDKLASQNQQLLAYHARLEDDRSLAVRFMEKLSALDRITDPAVHFRLIPAEDFGGDLIAVARTPNDCLHVMLGDSAGHGLTAALSIMPIVDPFYKMTAKGFDIPTITQELNKRVRQYVSLPRYVAVNLISVDFRERIISAWNGGCPDGLVMGADRQIAHRFISRHLPLGLLKESEFDNTVEHYDYGDEPCQLFMCSDGVTELGVEEGDQIDLPELMLRCSAEGDRFEQLVADVTEKLHGQAVRDDIAMVCVDCQMPLEDVPHLKKATVLQKEGLDADNRFDETDHVVTWKMDMTLTTAQLNHLDVVPMLMNVTSTIEAGKGDAAIFMALSELFNNALDHGLLKLDSQLKQHGDMSRYYEERQARLAALTEGQIEIGLERVESRFGNWLKLRVRDSGDGFDHAAVYQRELSEHQRHGRGLTLLHGLCDFLEFRGNGSEAVAYLDISV